MARDDANAPEADAPAPAPVAIPGLSELGLYIASNADLSQIGGSRHADYRNRADPAPRYRASDPAGADGIGRWRLAAAVTNAGGLGMIGSGYCGDIPPGQPDFLTPYLRAIFATIGISLVEFLRLEGLSRGLEAVAQALDRANTWIEQRLPGLLR
jgi:hypothetical protein